MTTSQELNKVEVCFAPCDFHQYEEGFDLIVVIDVLRATSAICTAIEYGVKGIIPVATIEEAKEFKKKGLLFQKVAHLATMLARGNVRFSIRNWPRRRAC